MRESAKKPTGEQSEVLTEAVSYLSASDHSTLLLEGSAGTGKTTLIAWIVEALQSKLKAATGKSYKAIMPAPTNKAVEVLREKGATSKATYTDYCTLHSALRLRYSIDEKSGAEIFTPDKSNRENKLGGATILVVDEASMIGADLLQYVEERIEEERHLKVIFIGDIKQLPPVNEDTSPVFTKGYFRLSLKEIIRQAAENPIISLSNDIYQLNNFQDHVNAEGLGYSYTKDRSAIIRHFARHRDDLGIRYLGYTNACVNAFNEEVRREIFHQPSKIEIGETIIFDRPYEVVETDDFGDPYKYVYTNNQEVLVENIEVCDEEMDIPWDKNGGKQKVRLKYYVVNDSFPILHEESEFVFADLMETLRRKAINKDFYWRDLYAIRNAFVAFKHRYALTVHKAQGSTYREVFLDYDDMMRNNSILEREKLLYTAITRASKHLTIWTSRLRDGR